MLPLPQMPAKGFKYKVRLTEINLHESLNMLYEVWLWQWQNKLSDKLMRSHAILVLHSSPTASHSIMKASNAASVILQQYLYCTARDVLVLQGEMRIANQIKVNCHSKYRKNTIYMMAYIWFKKNSHWIGTCKTKIAILYFLNIKQYNKKHAV